MAEGLRRRDRAVRNSSYDTTSRAVADEEEQAPRPTMRGIMTTVWHAWPMMRAALPLDTSILLTSGCSKLVRFSDAPSAAVTNMIYHTKECGEVLRASNNSIVQTRVSASSIVTTWRVLLLICFAQTSQARIFCSYPYQLALGLVGSLGSEPLPPLLLIVCKAVDRLDQLRGDSLPPAHNQVAIHEPTLKFQVGGTDGRVLPAWRTSRPVLLPLLSVAGNGCSVHDGNNLLTAATVVQHCSRSLPVQVPPAV